jgi:hypothetical protein
MDCKTHPKDGVRPFLSALPPPPMPDPAMVKVENLTIKGPSGDDLRLLILLPVGSSLCSEGTPVVRKRSISFPFQKADVLISLSTGRGSARRWRDYGCARVRRC